MSKMSVKGVIKSAWIKAAMSSYQFSITNDLQLVTASYREQ